MNRTLCTATFAAAAMIGLGILSSSSAAHAAVSITVTPSLAPNAFGSPSWSAYVGNAVSAIENGQTSLGSGASK